jgi:hypothetical protein
MVELAIAFGLGWLIARLDDIISIFRESGERKERMALFDKALTKGDGAALYNLRVAESVSSDPRTLNNAVAQEVARNDTEHLEPWADHPVYGRCEIQMSPEENRVYILDPTPEDGPDTWTEPLDEFFSKFEDPPIAP